KGVGPDKANDIGRDFARPGAHVPLHQFAVDQLVARPVLPFQQIFGRGRFGASLGEALLLQQVRAHGRLLSLALSWRLPVYRRAPEKAAARAGNKKGQVKPPAPRAFRHLRANCGLLMAPVPRAGVLARRLEAPQAALAVMLLEGVLHVGPLVLIPRERRVHRPPGGKGLLTALARALALVVVRHIVRV